MGTYQTSGGLATLMLIEYPKPQLAAEHLRKIDAANQSKGSAASRNSDRDRRAPIFNKRTGPIVVIATGTISQGEARSSVECGELRSRRHLERKHISGQEK